MRPLVENGKMGLSLVQRVMSLSPVIWLMVLSDLNPSCSTSDLACDNPHISTEELLNLCGVRIVKHPVLMDS